MSNSNDDFLTDNITISGVEHSSDTCSITLPPLISTIDLSNVTIGATGSSNTYFYNSTGMHSTTDTYFTTTIGGTGNGTITINGGVGSVGSVGSTASWQWEEPNPFENGFPNWQDFTEMCKEYPGLEKTFEHLKVFYKLCKDEWDAKKKGNK